MTAKDFLKQYEYAVKRIRRLEEEYEAETLLIDAVRSVSDNDGMPHGSGISKPTEEKAVRLADKKIRLTEARLEAIRTRQIIFDMIEKVGGDEADVLYQRYVKLKPDGSRQTWEEVCEAVYWSWFKVSGLHRSGLEKVEKLLK
jgi:hypothetical protein